MIKLLLALSGQHFRPSRPHKSAEFGGILCQSVKSFYTFWPDNQKYPRKMAENMENQTIGMVIASHITDQIFDYVYIIRNKINSGTKNDKQL